MDQQKYVKAAAANRNCLSIKSCAKKRKSNIKRHSNQIKKVKPLFEHINDFIQNAGFFHDHNDSFLMELKEKLLSIGQLDWERHHVSEKQELIEIYRTDEINIDQEFKMELEQSLLEATQSCRTEVIQALKKELLKHF